MKKFKSILVAFLLLSIIFPVKEIFAATSVSWAAASYEEVAGVRGEYSAELFFNANEYIGIISGEISWDSDYISDVSVTGVDWMLSYNPNNGKFQVVKSSGSKSATIAKITYTIIKACPDGKDLIHVNNISYTSTTYSAYSESSSLSLVIMTDHCEEHAYGDWEISKSASCTENGIRQKVCEDCGDIVTEEIPATGHTPVVDEAVSPTCTETGLTEGSHCQICGEVIEKQNEVPATGHTWEDDYTVDEEATCTEDGSESIHCAVCDEIKEGTSRAISKTGHSYGDWTVTEEPTCTGNGSREKECSICGDKVTESVPATGHTWEDDYTVDEEATCTEDGSESIHCAVCDEIKEGTSRAISKTGHSYGDWKTVTEATYDETGLKERVCTLCGDVQQEVIEKKQRVSIRNASVVIPNQTYTGKALEPKATVTVDGTVLSSDSDYTIAYTNNTNAGTATVTITGKGSYTGAVDQTFTIAKAAQNFTVKAASSINVGKTTKVTVSGAKETPKFTFTSSNTKVATVNSAGTVTGKAAGTVTITVKTAATANYKEGTKTVKITVNKVLKKPGNCHFVKWNNSKYTSCRIAWNKAAGAEGYQTLLSWTDGSHASSTIVKSSVLYRNCTVHPQHVSQMKVRAFYMQNGQRKYGPWSNVEYITPSPTKLTAKNASSGSNLKMNINWNIIYGCNGYNVFLTTNPNGTWYWNQSTSVNAASTKAVITKYRGSKLKKNTRYYVRIVTRRKRNGVFCTVPMPAANTNIGSFIIK